MMVAECIQRRNGVGVTPQIGDHRRGRRWVPPYQRPVPPNENRQYSIRQAPCYYRPPVGYRNEVPTTMSAKPSYSNVARQTSEKLPPQPANRYIGAQQLPSPVTPPTFQILYQEFENMKKRGFVLNSDTPPDISSGTTIQREPVHTTQIKAPPAVNGNFADAMKIFMQSYYPTSSFTCAKPVADWSKEAGNLLQELTDKESQSDLDTSTWNIPNADVGQKLQPKGRLTCEPIGRERNLWSTSPPKCNEDSSITFDIHRHLMELNPSPYPGGSPISTGQSASNHSSDNDADDEGNQSANEKPCSKAIGAKKSLKKRLNSSFTCSTMDSGYLSSANESDGSRGNALNIRLPGPNIDSDDLSSECGFTSSTCPSWPNSPLPSYTARENHSERRLSNGPLLPHPNIQQFRNLPMGMPPIPPPMPPYLSAMPIPPPPHFLQAAFHPAASVGPQALTRGSQLPPPPLPGFALMGAIPPPHYPILQALATQPNPVVTGESPNAADFSANGVYHKHKAWITDEILEMIAVRDRLYKRMKKHPAPDIVEMYKKVRNMVVGMTRNAKRSYEKQFEEQQVDLHLQNVVHRENFSLFNLSSCLAKPFVPITWDRSYV